MGIKEVRDENDNITGYSLEVQYTIKPIPSETEGFTRILYYTDMDTQKVRYLEVPDAEVEFYKKEIEEAINKQAKLLNSTLKKGLLNMMEYMKE